MPENIILSSLKVGGQFPLNSKTYFKTLAELQDLGQDNVNAFGYYEGMIVNCVETKNRYVWREEETEGEIGILAQSVTYPANTISEGIDYSNRTFNFFKLKISDLLNDSQFITIDDLPNVPEYALSPISGTNTVDLLKDGQSVSQIDLKPYLDDTNLARIVSGVVEPSTGIATITRDDATTFTIDFSSLIDVQPTSTQELSNNGADGTSTYVEHDEIIPLATQGLEVQNENGIPLFTATEFLKIKGFDVDEVEGLISLPSEKENTIYLHSTLGDDNTGVIGLKSKPFQTLEAARLAYRDATQTLASNERTAFIFDFLDNATYTATDTFDTMQNLSISATVRPYLRFQSNYPCKIVFDSTNAAFNVLNQYSSTLERTSQLEFDLPYGEITFTGGNHCYLMFGSTAVFGVGYGKVNGIINKLTIPNDGAYYSVGYVTYSKLKFNEIDISYGAVFRAVTDYCDIDFGNLNILASASGIQNTTKTTSIIRFNKIISDAVFTLLSSYNGKFTVYHGDIVYNSASLSNYIKKCEVDIIFKDNAVIESTAGGKIVLGDFNASSYGKLIGNKVTYKTDCIFTDNNSYENYFEFDIRTLICENNLVTPNGAFASSLRFINCNLIVEGTVFSTLSSSDTYLQMLETNTGADHNILEFIGDNTINSNLGESVDVIANKLMPTSGNKFKAFIDGSLKIYKGNTIDANTEVVSSTLVAPTIYQ